MHINTINAKHTVEFDQGRFDAWCVYLKRQGQGRRAPRDDEYFSFFKRLAIVHSAAKVYGHFVEIYNATSATYNQNAVGLIKQISATYGADAEEAEVWFSVVYGGMVAEENKAGTVLKKRIKRLGMYQLLLENFEPVAAANFSRNKRAGELSQLMQARGF